VHVKVEDNTSLFPDLFDTEDFLVDHPQEVPSLITDLPTSPGSSYEYSPLDSPVDSPGSATCFSPESFHGVGSPEDSSFASCFKGKAAQDDHVQFGLVVPEEEHGMADELGLVPTGIDIICCDADGNISLAGDACFVPGDIPGLEAFDDCSLSFDLALRGAAEALEGDRTGNTPHDHFVARVAFIIVFPCDDILLPMWGLGRERPKHTNNIVECRLSMCTLVVRTSILSCSRNHPY